MNILLEKVISNLWNYGNIFVVFILLVLDEVVREGFVKLGDIIVVFGFGVGLSWGVVIF